MRNRREVVRNQKIAVVSVLAAVTAVILLSVLFGSIKAQAAPAEVSYKYYTSVRIEAGDTLWEIAGAYITDDYENMDIYLDEICSINHISKDDIHAGQYITVPYYSSDYLE